MATEVRSVFKNGNGSDNSSIGAKTWVNPNNISAGDSVFAMCGLGSGNQSHYLQASSYGFTIAGATRILGIQVDVRRSLLIGANVSDGSLYLVQNGVIQSTSSNKAAVVVWTSSAQDGIYGSATDLWGGSWSPSDIRADGFGAVISCALQASVDTANVDAITISVYYSTEVSVNAGLTMTGCM